MGKDAEILENWNNLSWWGGSLITDSFISMFVKADILGCVYVSYLPNPLSKIFTVTGHPVSYQQTLTLDNVTGQCVTTFPRNVFHSTYCWQADDGVQPRLCGEFGNSHQALLLGFAGAWTKIIPVYHLHRGKKLAVNKVALRRNLMLHHESKK